MTIRANQGTNALSKESAEFKWWSGGMFRTVNDLRVVDTGGMDMAGKKTKTAAKKAAKKLVCDDCGLVVVVEDQCGCGCIPVCCDTPMKAK